MSFRVIRSLAVVSAFFAVSLSAYAAEPASQACPPVDVPALAPPGVRAFIDPATGKHRAPTVQELRQIAEARLQARRAKLATLVVETHPGGMKSVDLGDAFLMDVVIPDGAARMRCVPAAGRALDAANDPLREK